MKINNQYQEAEAIYPVTGLYIAPEGNAMEKEEMLLSEHRMDVYINDVLTMKLVCTPKDLPGKLRCITVHTARSCRTC